MDWNLSYQTDTYILALYIKINNILKKIIMYANIYCCIALSNFLVSVDFGEIVEQGN